MQNDYANQILSGPKKKAKKKYILFLHSKNAAQGDLRAIERGFSREGKDKVIIRLHEPEGGLKVLMLKSIDLIILDHSIFEDEATAAEFAAELKKRRKVPILFVCKDEQRLIAAYREHLPLYQELDDYVLSPVDSVDFANRFKRSVSGIARAAKRFELDAPVKVFRLNDNRLFEARLTDVSIVGLGLKVSGVRLMRNEQVRVILPLKHFEIFHPQFGDLFKIAAKVRRVSLEGESIGCSIEHLTPLQSECLNRVLEQLNARAFLKAARRG
jgi:hypothetical protein